MAAQWHKCTHTRSAQSLQLPTLATIPLIWATMSLSDSPHPARDNPLAEPAHMRPHGIPEILEHPPYRHCLPKRLPVRSGAHRRARPSALTHSQFHRQGRQLRRVRSSRAPSRSTWPQKSSKKHIRYHNHLNPCHITKSPPQIRITIAMRHRDGIVTHSAYDAII